MPARTRQRLDAAGDLFHGGEKRKRRVGGGGGGGVGGGIGSGQSYRVGGPPRRRPKGYCMCPACGTKVAIYTEVPCYIMNCVKCGSTMVKQAGNSKHPQGLPQGE